MKYKPGTFIVTPNKDRIKGKPSAYQTVYIWLCEHVDDSGVCYPRRKTIAQEAGCDIKTVDKYLNTMVEDGIISKTTRKKEGTNENTSNLYQILIWDDPSTEIGATPSPENGAETNLIINSPTLTQVPDVPSEPDEEVKLPEKYGKTAYARLAHVYRRLWSGKFGMDVPDFPFAKFNMIMKKLLVSNNEYQIAILLLTYFNWYGISGKDQNEYLYLSNKGFPIEMLPSKFNNLVIHLTNVGGLVYNSKEDVIRYAVKHLKDVL